MNAFPLRHLALIVLAAAATACTPRPVERPADPAVVTRAPAAVAMPDSFSAQSATRILEGGGNAVDAAVAAAFVLAVTYPEAGNIGGGGFMMIFHDGQAAFLDYRESAPAAATADMYLDAQGEVIDDASLVGHRAIGVPGTVAGLWAAHQRYGSLPWARLLAPAIELAREGFVASAHLARRVQGNVDWYAGRTNFGRYFGPMQAGVVFQQPTLAATLERIAAQGRDGFYTGETAALIEAEMIRGGGLITQEDLGGYEAIWRAPIAVRWREYRLLAPPLPSSGGFALVQLLKMKDFLAEEFDGLAHNSPPYIHLIAEMEKRVFADRAEYLGDPDFVEVPIERLIDEDYIARRAAEVRVDSISTLEEVRPGLEGISTTHFSIVDHDGNAVSNTYTLNTWFGSGVVVEGAGFLLNNEMDDFAIKPGMPNYYGVVGSNANAIAPGKRMLSSMSPTILLRDGEVAMVVGTPGGSTIFTSVFQTIVNVLDFNMSPIEALAATRFHHQLLPPERIVYSPCCPLPETTVQALEAMGYRPRPSSWEFGDVQLVRIDTAGVIHAASDPRGRGDSRVLGEEPHRVAGPVGDREATSGRATSRPATR